MITWRENYNCFSAAIAGGAITMSVYYNMTAPKGSAIGYVVQVNNRRLKSLFLTARDGQKAAIRLARKILSEATKELADEDF